MVDLNFIKMHGLGNDFVIIDRRKTFLKINKQLITRLSDRKTGAGCDQIITIDKSHSAKIDCKITIYNPNGDQVEACGNGTRCVAKLLFKEFDKKKINIKSIAGKLQAKLMSNGNVSVNMGIVKDKWKDIPINKNIDTKNIPIKVKNFSNGFALNIGNPHVVFFGNNIIGLNINISGPKIENHNLFPNKVNVEFVKIINKKKLTMRVWERGVGETLACGSGACAAVYAAYKKGLINKKCTVVLKKGSLIIDINKNNQLIMTGPAEISFLGKIII